MNMLVKLLAAAGFAALATSAHAQTVLRIGTIIPENTIQGESLNLFAKEFNEAQGKYQIQVFHGSQLGDGPTQVQAMQGGIQAGFVEDFAYYLPFSDDLRLTNTPYVFDNRDHFQRWVKSEGFAKILEKLEADAKIHVITGDTIWQRGPFRVMAARHPVMTLEDLSKTKLRLWASEVVTRYYGKEGLGANTVNIAFNETYLALSQGAVDAVTAPFDTLGGMKFAEVAKHIMPIDEFPQLLALSLSSRVWNGFDDAARALVVEKWNVAGAHYNKQLEGKVDEWKAELKASGATYHEDFDRAPFVARSNEITDKLVESGYWSRELIENLRALRQ